MTLEYWREYRTHFQIGVSWGLNESNVLRNIRKVENILIKSGLFNVEGKKKVQELDSETEVLVVDVAEHEVERPKKKRLAKERIVVEHVHRRLKIFRILSSRYRNRRRRFGLRINLIAGIYNYELYLSSQQVNGLPSVLSRFLPEGTSGARAAATAIA
jgi:hypothetical protein